MSAVDLLPCPFCGGEAKRHTLPADEFGNEGGDVIECTVCGASSHVEFGRKENLQDTWNRRAPVRATENYADPVSSDAPVSAGKVKALDRASVIAIVMDECWKDREMKLACRIEARILSALQPGDGWQPISTAPKDGRWIVGWFDFGPNDKRAICIRWDAPARHQKFPWLSDGGRFAETCLYRWTHLPASPQIDGEGEG